MFFEDEISSWLCFGATWRCTPYEAIGLWSCLLFYTTQIVTTLIHSVIQGQRGTATVNEAATRRHTTTDVGDDWKLLCSFMIYFFGLPLGSLLWVLAGIHSGCAAVFKICPVLGIL